MLRSLLPVVAAALLLGACEQPPSQAPASSVPPPAQPVQGPPTAVYFDTGRATLSPQATASIRQVAADVKAKGNATVSLTGHTDTVGSPAANTALAERRVEAVRSALVRQGVASAAITATAHGEVSLPVPTADNVKERRNRSVDIAIVVPASVAHMSDAEYCAALSAKYREYRTSQIDEEAAAAMGKCKAGDAAAAIAVLERHLAAAKVPLPARS